MQTDRTDSYDFNGKQSRVGRMEKEIREEKRVE